MTRTVPTTGLSRPVATTIGVLAVWAALGVGVAPVVATLAGIGASR